MTRTALVDDSYENATAHCMQVLRERLSGKLVGSATTNIGNVLPISTRYFNIALKIIFYSPSEVQ